MECAPQTRSRCLLHSGSSSWARPFVTATLLHRNSSLVLWLVRFRSYCYTSLAFLWATRVGFLDQVAKRRPSRCVRPLQRSRVENHRTRGQLRSGELCRRTIPSTKSCRAVYSIPRKSTWSVTLGNALRCRAESPLQERGTLRSEYRAFFSSQVEAEVPGVSTVRLFLVSAKTDNLVRRRV